MLKEAKRLHDFGFAIHWIEPNSKKPVNVKDEKGVTLSWSERQRLFRDDWDTAGALYKKGYGLGALTGEPSYLDGRGYLANVDVDIKSSDPRHEAEALAFVEAKFPGLLKAAPCVRTGYGYRLFFLSASPVDGGKLSSSPDQVTVLMPTSKATGLTAKAVQTGLLSKEQVAQGYRRRGAWEVELFSEGRQVLMPPSVHPDTGVLYAWQRPLRSLKDLPLLEDLPQTGKAGGAGRPRGSKVVQGFRPVAVDLGRLPLQLQKLIREGSDRGDRSADAIRAGGDMLTLGLSDAEVMSVLTDRNYVTGQGALERRGGNLPSAAAWVRDYVIAAWHKKYDPAEVFRAAGPARPTKLYQPVRDGKAEKKREWQGRLKRTGKNHDGPPACSMENVVTVLTGTAGDSVFKWDEFASRDVYGGKTPWGGEADLVVSDKDSKKIRLWLGTQHGFEPATTTIDDCIVCIADANTYHPVRQWLRALPPWDGEPRLGTWLVDHFGAHGPTFKGLEPSEYFKQIMEKWLLAAVVRVFEPGAIFQWVPIFQGKQEYGKSAFGEVLAGRDYHLEGLPPLADKDASLNLQGNWFVEFGELNNLSRHDIDDAKAYITRAIDKCRPPHGRRMQIYKRQCVFYGTTDKPKYLRDEAGNRRFNPVMVGPLDMERLRRERDMLWAEALYLYDHHYSNWQCLKLSGEAALYAPFIREDKMVEDESTVTVEKILDFIENNNKLELSKIDLNKFKLSDLFELNAPLWPAKYDAKTSQQAAKALKSLGGIWSEIKGRNYWRLPPRGR